ncbi:type III secretion system inner rod subunit SctI [Pantoea sp. PNT02]|uniref:type III secretion system inner rod subunit SctI n=1 Tax=Pantoea sp. PNT02 TaxID=2769261 RepID=UPI0017804109|nr:type III secretion system inner rod subunit SctI [Pantoea sp. PNT02]MBD9646325.1 type III secretion system inner rod subunit SctI [Pantoea sp. PNT02]
MMEISQLKAALAQSLSLRESGPDAGQIAAFQEKLSAGRAAKPEQTLVNQMQVQQSEMVKGLEQTQSVTALTPASALAIQTGLANTVIGVDVVAKVAGSFSQAINKLVTMQ